MISGLKAQTANILVPATSVPAHRAAPGFKAALRRVAASVGVHLGAWSGGAPLERSRHGFEALYAKDDVEPGLSSGGGGVDRQQPVVGGPVEGLAPGLHHTIGWEQDCAT